jgi:hypothetical protein
MDYEQGERLIGEVVILNMRVTELAEKNAHLSDQLDLMHGTLVVQTNYLIWTFSLIGLTLAFVACLLGYKIARGR